MLRTRCSFFTWVALCGLLAPAVAHAQAPAAVPVPPVPGVPAPTAGTSSSASSTSYNQPIPSYNQPMPSDATATVIDAPSYSGTPTLSGAPGSGTVANADAGLGVWRQRVVQPFASVETLFLAPVHNTGGGGANYTLNDGPTTTSYSASSANGMVATPRLTLGLMNQRWGIGVRYWQFSNDPAGAQFPGGTSQGVYSQGLLKLQTFDFEAIRRFQFYNQQMWFTVGTRYAEFARDSSVSSSDYFNHSVYSASASSGARFNGVGLTTSLSGMCPLGVSNWNLFYGGRVSYLAAGNSSAFAQTSASYVSNVNSSAVTYPAGSLANGDAFIGELQIGTQYNHTLEFMPATVFFRVALEYQYWHVNNGCSASANSYAGPLSGSQVASTAAAGDSNLGLLGFGVSTGFTW